MLIKFVYTTKKVKMLIKRTDTTQLFYKVSAYVNIK